MKKTFIMFVLVILGVGMAYSKCKADNIINNNLTKNFAKELDEYDENRDGEFSEEELSVINEIAIRYGDDINKVRGISVLKNLKYLYLVGGEDHNLEELSELKNLKRLTLTYKNTKSGKFNIDVKCKYLNIYCEKEVTSLNISNIKRVKYGVLEAPNLKKIKMKNNKIEQMTINGIGTLGKTLKGFTGMKMLNVFNGKGINTLKCSNLKGVKELNLWGVYKKKISVTKCKSLEEISIKYLKKVKKVNITNNKKLKNLDFNKVNAKCKIKNNPKIKKIKLRFCKIKKLDCLKFKNLKKIHLCGGRIDKLDFSNCHKLTEVEVNGSGVKSVKIPKKNKIKNFIFWHNKLKQIDIKYLTKAENIDVEYNKLSGTIYMPSKVADNVSIDLAYNKINKVIFPKKIFIFSFGLDHNKIRNVYMNGSELHIYDFRHNPPMTIYDGIVKGGHPHRDKGTKLVNCK